MNVQIETFDSEVACYANSDGTVTIRKEFLPDGEVSVLDSLTVEELVKLARAILTPVQIVPTTTRQTIICPKCEAVQAARVDHAPNCIWAIYVHHCAECQYVIMESEWEQVKA